MREKKLIFHFDLNFGNCWPKLKKRIKKSKKLSKYNFRLNGNFYNWIWTFSLFFNPRLQHNLESKSSILREFCLFRSNLESWRQEIQQFHFKIHLQILNHTQYCGKVERMLDMCFHKIEGLWVRFESVCEGDLPPSPIFPESTQFSSSLCWHISGIFHTFPQYWVWFRIF